MERLGHTAVWAWGAWVQTSVRIRCALVVVKQFTAVPFLGHGNGRADGGLHGEDGRVGRGTARIGSRGLERAAPRLSLEKLALAASRRHEST